MEYDVSFACFEGAGEHGEDIPLAVVYHNALNPNFEIDVIDMRTHEPPYRLGEGVRVAVGSPYGCEHGDDVDPGASSMPIAPRIQIPAIPPFCRARMAWASRVSRSIGISSHCNTARKACRTSR